MKTKFIFITGGVVSGLGKGIAAASIGALLESRGLKISLMKLDPYINVDAGTMNPFQHGEVFVTEDGAETDLDLGHYERYTNCTLSKNSNCTTGKIYDRVIKKEREGKYLGATIQVVPHIIDEMKQTIIDGSDDADIAIVEIGGTVGDIESLPFLEAIRQFAHDHGRSNCIFVHLTMIVYVGDDEMKTKPTQHSVGKMREIGIQPDILICRTKTPMSSKIKKKISLFTNVQFDAVINGMDVDTVYEVPIKFHSEGLDTIIIDYLKMWTRNPILQDWAELVDRFKNPNMTVNIAFVGKYVDQKDAYYSLNEALVHGGIANQVEVNLCYISSEEIEKKTAKKLLKNMDAILVAPGFGDRGIEGKISAVKHARENKIPFFGICLGMQLALIEFARNVAGIKNANSAEFRPNHKQNVIDIMPDQDGFQETGGTMRLGGQTVRFDQKTLIANIYQAKKVTERHRHRYEVMNGFVDQLKQAGLIISGTNPTRKLVETIELKDHPWFIGSQYHPELKSKPFKPHPLFRSFIAAAKSFKTSK